MHMPDFLTWTQSSCDILKEYLALALVANGCILISNPYKYFKWFKGDRAV